MLNDLQVKVVDVEKKYPRLKSRRIKCVTTKSTPSMSMMVCHNCKKRFERWKTGLVETTYK